MNEALLSQCRYLHDLRLWTHVPTPRVERWLGNFLPDELPFAEALLEAFIYLNDQMIDRLFASAFHNLSGGDLGSGASYASRQAEWQRFRGDVHITHVTGEEPNSSDSGYAFARRARMSLLVDQSHIFPPDEALRQQLVAGPTPLIFVDDFAGSGNQLLDTWTREVVVGTVRRSFAATAQAGVLGPVFYCLPVITSYALERLAVHAPDVSVRAAHVLSANYGAGHPDSLLFPAALLADKDGFLRQVTARAFGPNEDPLGFHGLGLALAFEYGPPDATLPIVWKEHRSWTALVPRR